jgi:hypothetical protein
MPNKGAFVRGDPRAGRPPGSQNKTSKDARELAQKLINDPEYLAGLMERLVEGRLGPLEIELWRYAYGPPPAHPITAMDEFLEAVNARQPPEPE